MQSFPNTKKLKFFISSIGSGISQPVFHWAKSVQAELDTLAVSRANVFKLYILCSFAEGSYVDRRRCRWTGLHELQASQLRLGLGFFDFDLFGRFEHFNQFSSAVNASAR